MSKFTWKKDVVKKPDSPKIETNFNDIYKSDSKKESLKDQDPIDLKDVRGKIKTEHKKSQKYFNRTK